MKRLILIAVLCLMPVGCLKRTEVRTNNVQTTGRYHVRGRYGSSDVNLVVDHKEKATENEVTEIEKEIPPSWLQAAAGFGEVVLPALGNAWLPGIGGGLGGAAAGALSGFLLGKRNEKKKRENNG